MGKAYRDCMSIPFLQLRILSSIPSNILALLGGGGATPATGSEMLGNASVEVEASESRYHFSMNRDALVQLNLAEVLV